MLRALSIARRDRLLRDGITIGMHKSFRRVSLKWEGEAKGVDGYELITKAMTSPLVDLMIIANEFTDFKK